MPLGLPDRETVRRIVPQCYAAISATMGGCAFGTVLGWSSPALVMLKDEYDYDDEDLSWVAGIPPLGALLSMLLTALTLDRFGRKLVMLCLVPPFVTGWGVLAFFHSIPMLLVGRFITGFCGAAFCTAAPVYIGEIAEKSIRGALGVCFQLLLTIGILYVYLMGKWADVMWLSLLAGVIPLVFFTLFFLMPESPMYLLQQDRRDDAVKALQWLRGPTGDISGDLAIMDETIAAMRSHTGNLKEKMSTKAAIKGLGIGLGLMFCQQLSGINIIIFYSASIFVAAGTDMDASDCIIIVGVVQVLATCLSAALVDRAGRRLLLLVSHSGMCCCLVAMGVYFYMKDNDEESVKSIGWLPLVATCVYLIMFSLGSGPLPWSMIGELFPQEIKGICSGICGFVNFVLVFIVSKTFTNLQNALTAAGSFWMYGCFCVTSTVWITFFVLETRNKTLEEIQEELGGT